MSAVFSIALSGMQAAETRLVNAAKNIVNSSSTGTLPSDESETTNVYTPTDVQSSSQNVGSYSLGVSTTIVDRDPAYYPMYDPTSEYADEDGFVAATNVDLASEALDVLQAKITYEASAKIIGVEKENEETLLDTLA